MTKNDRKKIQPGSRTVLPERIFKYSPDVILTVDHKRRILFMSRAMNQFKPEEMLGSDSVQIFPMRVRPWYRQALATAFKNKESGRFQFPTMESVWWEIRLVPLQRVDKVEEVMIIATEVTESRIQQAQTIRHARLATIGVLAASIAHEINNPNNAILFNGSLMARSWQDAIPILEEYFQTHGDFSLGGLPYSEARATLPGVLGEISHNTMRVKNIVDNLKHLARRDQETLLETVNLHEPLRAALMILNYKIRKHTDHCEFLPTRTALPVKGNSRQLEQVFINVILNALQSLAERKQRVWVRTALETDGQEQMALVVIEDEGCGIPPEHLSQVTEPFFTTKSTMDGTGLGLSISNLIIKNHRGSIRFSSEVGRGTTVTIRFPVFPA
ncbi:MAG: PAS domain-containing protein [Magnetococcales bacterium]|nr:PAS domain-containing protein [Magnetococcales bacterium]